MTTALASVTIAAGQASGSGTLTLTPVSDAVVEGDETIVVDGAVTGFTVSSATITLTDDDTATLSVSGPTSAVNEGADATFTVTLSHAVDAGVTVAWSAPGAGDDAVVGDLGSTSGDVTFPANSPAGAIRTITIGAVDDMLSEGDETFTVTLGTVTSDLSDRVEVVTDSAEATIAESDPITIEITGPATVAEGAMASYTVSLSPSGVTPTSDLTVDYATSDGTATVGADYTASSGTLTFTTASAGEQSFTVTTLQDVLDDDDETFTATISNATGGGGPAPTITPTSATTTIVDDDGTPTGITLSVDSTSIGEADGETDVTVTATLEGSSTLTTATTVTLTLSGTASDPGDYTVTTALAIVTIAAGQPSGSGMLTLTPVSDAVVEGDETIVVDGAVTGFTVTSATITLQDDDEATLSISGPASAVSEGSDATFTVTLSHAVDESVTVAWSAPQMGDDAVAGDLGSTSGDLTFPANSAAGATRTITIGAVDDLLSEGDETFTVTLGAITSGRSDRVSLATGAASATATIAESDPITVEITGPATVAEGASADYTVSLSPSGVTPTADLSVDYATSDGTATADTDYTSATGTLTFTTASAGEQTFTVTTLQDVLDDDAETYTAFISNPNGGGGGPTPTVSTTDSSVTTTITDDDGTPTAITLSVDPTAIGEADGETDVTVTATLEGSSTLTTATTVTLSLSGTAADPGDYAVTTALASVTIPAGEASGSGTLTLTPVSDAVVEGDETVVVDGEVTGFTVSSATITLEDDDTATLSVSGPASAVSEGSDATFTVTLSHAVAADVTVAWSAPGAGDDAVAADLGATSGTVTFTANSAAGAERTITIGAVDDMLSEGDEAFTLTLGTITSDLSDRVSLATGAASAEATIAESDPITIEITGPATVAEGAMATYTVRLMPAGVTPTADLTVDYATSDGTATAGSDYTASSGTLTFTTTSAGAQTVTVDTLQDVLDDDAETFTVTMSNVLGGGGPAPTIAPTSVTTTIIDDDGTPTGITLSVDSTTIGEADGGDRRDGHGDPGGGQHQDHGHHGEPDPVGDCGGPGRLCGDDGAC